MKKIVGGVATRFEYGADGELIAERNDSTGADDHCAAINITWSHH